MTLQQLKYVIAIVEKGSIDEAAKVLYLSQPSLTKAIHEFFGNYAFCCWKNVKKWNKRMTKLGKEDYTYEFIGF